MSAPQYMTTLDGRTAKVTRTASGTKVEIPAKGNLPAETVFTR